jgi:hypothetical protein
VALVRAVSDDIYLGDYTVLDTVWLWGFSLVGSTPASVFSADYFPDVLGDDLSWLLYTCRYHVFALLVYAGGLLPTLAYYYQPLRDRAWARVCALCNYFFKIVFPIRASEFEFGDQVTCHFAVSEAEEGHEDAFAIEPRDVDLAMAQARCSRVEAVRALKRNKGDVLNAIMALQGQKETEGDAPEDTVEDTQKVEEKSEDPNENGGQRAAVFIAHCIDSNYANGKGNTGYPVYVAHLPPQCIHRGAFEFCLPQRPQKRSLVRLIA